MDTRKVQVRMGVAEYVAAVAVAAREGRTVSGLIRWLLAREVAAAPKARPSVEAAASGVVPGAPKARASAGTPKAPPADGAEPAEPSTKAKRPWGKAVAPKGRSDCGACRKFCVGPGCPCSCHPSGSEGSPQFVGSGGSNPHREGACG